MNTPKVDLFSDTKTRPSKPMLNAMINAENKREVINFIDFVLLLNEILALGFAKIINNLFLWHILCV